MRYQKTQERRAVILMVVLSLLTLFAVVGITFVLYADAEAAAARVYREAETAQRADIEPEQALAYFLGQFLYDVNDTTGVGSGLRGHSLARTMYGYHNAGAVNYLPFNGVGRLHYPQTLSMLNPATQTQLPVTIDDYTMVNYTWFSADTFGLRDPERYGFRLNPAAPQVNYYVGGNAPYTYPDLNNFFLAAVKADGTVLTPSFHRHWLFNPGKAFNDITNPNWTNPQGKYLTLRPRPAEHPTFPMPDDAFGDVKNLVWAPGGNDSIWIDLGAPVMTAPDGTQYKMLFAPLIFDLDGRINLNTAGNLMAYTAAMTKPLTWQIASTAHVSNQGWGPWAVNLSKVMYGDQATWLPSPPTTPPTTPSTPPEWMRLFTGATPVQPTPPALAPTALPGLWAYNPPLSPPLGVSALLPPGVPGRYLQNPPQPGLPTAWTPTVLGTSYLGGNYPSPTGTYPHFYAPVDFNGMNELNNLFSSSRPLPPGYPLNPLQSNPAATPVTSPFAWFQQGFANGLTTENANHPSRFNAFQTPLTASLGTRAFRAADMEALLRPNRNIFTSTQGPADANASGVMNDLIRLCPNNFGPNAASPRYRNLVTTLSWDLGAPGVSPYWWQGMPATSYLTPNPTTPFVPLAGAATFPPVPPAIGVTNLPGTNPITSEFGPDWRALTANTMTYSPTQFVFTSPTTPPVIQSYTSPGARIRLNRAMPPYPHMGTYLTPPYSTVPNTPTTPLSAYGVAYDFTNIAIATQYQAALNARQALATDIYRRLVALTGAFSPFTNPAHPALASNPPTPTQIKDLANLATRRWLAQLAVNIVDYIDEDDISTPFNFYTVADGLATANIGATTGNDDPGVNPNNYPYAPTSTNNTGANPDYWVFGTELPKVVLNEVLAEAIDTNPADEGGSQNPPESVKVWVELFNTMPTTANLNTIAPTTQQQDSYRVPLYITIPKTATGYSPYRVSISQTLMNTPPTGVAAAVPGGNNYLPDPSFNVLGKAYIGNAYSATPLPTSTTDKDFAAPIPLIGGGTQAVANGINAGVDPQGFFLIGPPLDPNYKDPFVAATANTPGVPGTTPMLRSQYNAMMYSPTKNSWPGGGKNDERTTGLTVMLRRLANPYLPFNPSPSVPNPNLPGTFLPNPAYNPYVTVDYIQNLAIVPTSVKPIQSTGKTQPYAANHIISNPPTPGSPVLPQLPNANPPPAGAVTANNVVNTFGFANYPLPPSGHYDWLVHLDRPPISPMELLHVSAWPPYMLTQRFMLGSDNLATPNPLNPPNPANTLNMFGHYAPWFDAPPLGTTLANLACPWWFDSSLTFATQSHRLYRLFEFLECGDRSLAVNGLGRIPGRVNINTVWDAEILQALIDANQSMGIVPNPQQTPYLPATDFVSQIFANMMASRSPTYFAGGAFSGTVGAVNMGTGTDDHPFLPLSTGLTTGGVGTQYPNTLNVSFDTILRMNNPFNNPGAYPLPSPAKNYWLLFQNYSDTAATAHPYLQTQLLTKLYNNITTRSNTFAVFLTVGFFQVTNAATVPPTLGPEIGRSEGRQVRHRMFAIVDRTNMSTFTTGGTVLPPAASVTGPVPSMANPTGLYNPNGAQTIALPILPPPLTITGGTNPIGQPFLTVPNAQTGVPGIIMAGTQLVIDAGTPVEESVTVTAVTLPLPGPPPVAATITANFTLPHAAAISIIQRGNPGPWTLTPYNPRTDPYNTVRYFSIID